MNNKKILVFCLLLLSSPLFSQQEKPLNLPDYAGKKLNFGFALSLNAASYAVKYKPYDTVKATIQTRLGFDMAVVAEYNFNKRIGVRFLPAIDFQQRNVVYEVAHKNRSLEKFTQSLESSYLRLPLMARISYDRTGNKRLYYLVGGFYNIDLAQTKHQTPAVEHAVQLRVADTDYGACVGMGFDFFLPKFKMGIELKLNEGFKNILLPENTSPFNRLRTNACAISITFEG